MTDTFSRSLFHINETSTISWIIKSQVKCTNSDKIWTHLVLSWASESLNGFPCGILWILISEWNNKWRIKKGMWKILRSRATGWQKIDKKKHSNRSAHGMKYKANVVCQTIFASFNAIGKCSPFVSRAMHIFWHNLNDWNFTGNDYIIISPVSRNKIAHLIGAG